jgi:hypothetical protein
MSARLSIKVMAYFVVLNSMYPMVVDTMDVMKVYN